MKNELKNIRKQRGMSKKQLSLATGVTIGVITDIEDGLEVVVTNKDIRNIAKVLGSSIAEIFFNPFV